MEKNYTAFQIHEEDQVVTALSEIPEDEDVIILGNCASECPQDHTVHTIQKIPDGHKIAIRDIKEGEPIRKYGVVIGAATEDIKKGSWVHLHVMRSLYDERSNHLDTHTGAPTDIRYE